MKVKSSFSEIADNATVSLIYPGDYPDLNKRFKTISSGLSNGDGSFSLSPDFSFQPVVGDIFVLEAGKRKKNGADLLTIRTLIRWNGNGWDSLTRPVLVINAETTVLSIIFDYNRQQIRAADLFDKLEIIGQQKNFSGLSGQNGFNLDEWLLSKNSELVIRSLAEEKDPIGEIFCQQAICHFKKNELEFEYLVKIKQNKDFSSFLLNPNFLIEGIGPTELRIYRVKILNPSVDFANYRELFEYVEREKAIPFSLPVSDQDLPNETNLIPPTNDPLWAKQYALQTLQVNEGLAFAVYRDEVIVAVLDSGIDYTHPEFGGCEINATIQPPSCKLVNRTLWRDFFSQDLDPLDEFGQGTHISGMIAAVTNNAYGISGITNTDKIKILPVKVSGEFGQSSIFAIASGIFWAAENGAKIINLGSTEFPFPAKTIEIAINYATTVKDCLIITGSGSEQNLPRPKSYPSAYAQTISVSSVDWNDNIASFSYNQADTVDLSAPGKKIFSTLPSYENFTLHLQGKQKNFDFLDGNAQAAGFVSGLAAIIKAINPGFSRTKLINNIYQSVNDLGPAGKDDLFGFGRINFLKAINVEIPQKPVITHSLVSGIKDNWQLELRWEKVSKADEYLIYRDGFLLVTLNDNFYLDRGLTAAEHNYSIKACNFSGCSEESILQNKKAPTNTISPVGPNGEFQLNSIASGSQSNPAITSADNGIFVSAWSSVSENNQNEDSCGVFARIYDQNGPLAPEFLVNTFTSGCQQNPTVASDGISEFIVVWESLAQDGNGWGIYARRFDLSGTPLGEEFRVNSHTYGNQTDPTVAMNENGNFIIVWESFAQDGSGRGIYAQQFYWGGIPINQEFRVNSYTTDHQSNPAVASNNSGNFVITWDSNGQDDNGVGVFAKIFDYSGQALNSEFQVNTYNKNYQFRPAIGMAENGTFVITWSSYYQKNEKFNDPYAGIFGQRFTASGQRISGEFNVNTYVSGYQSDSSLDIDREGNFTVSWKSSDYTGDSIFAQRFNLLGYKIGSEFRINSETAGVQGFPATTMDRDGNLTVIWESFGQDGDSNGIFGQRYNNNGQPF